MSETKDQTIARLEGELKLAKRYDGRQVPKGVCDHSTDCNIWGDDGQGKVNGEYVSIPCSCGAHWNWAKKLEAELSASREMGPCGKHPKMFWAGAVEGTPIPVPEKKFRGEGRCEYCGSRIGTCPEGEFCTNQDCGYVDGWYNQRRMIEGHCTICAELAATRADAYERAAKRRCMWCAMGLDRIGVYHVAWKDIGQHSCEALDILSLITSTDAAARAELLIRCKSCGGTLRYKRTQEGYEGYEVYHDCIYGERGTAPRNIFRGKPNA